MIILMSGVREGKGGVEGVKASQIKIPPPPTSTLKTLLNVTESSRPYSPVNTGSLET